MIKTFQALSLEMSKREGKKQEQSIAQLNESLGVLCDICHDHPEALEVIKATGEKRATSKKGAPTEAEGKEA